MLSVDIKVNGMPIERIEIRNDCSCKNPAPFGNYDVQRIRTKLHLGEGREVPVIARIEKFDRSLGANALVAKALEVLSK